MPYQDQYGRWYNDYGQPIQPPTGYGDGNFDPAYTAPQPYVPSYPPIGGVRQPVPPGPDASAKMFQPGFEQMGHLSQSQRQRAAYGDVSKAPVEWERFPMFPTRPLINERPDVGYLTRYYVVEFDAQTVNLEATRNIMFDFPSQIVAVNAGVSQLPNNGSNTIAAGLENYTFLLQLREETGERINTEPTFGALVAGTAQRPGMLGGRGWSIDAGGTLIVAVTPLAPSLTISVALQVVELRAGSNYTEG